MRGKSSFLIRVLKLLVLFFAFNITAFAKTGMEDIFATASAHYSNEEYNEALALWNDIYDAGYDNHELLYNIGNAWYKLNNTPKAVLFYERALLRKPGDEDTRYNLAIAAGGVRDRFEEIPTLFFVRWLDYLTLSTSSDNWALLSFLTFVFCLIALLIFLFSGKRSVKGATLIITLLLLIISASSLFFSFRNRELVYNSNYAIVTEQAVTGRSTPSESGNELFVIHEGAKVSTEEVIGEWIEIRLPDGNKGWVKKESIIGL